MENIKELLNKEIKKGFETKEKYYKNEKELRDLRDKERYFWQDIPKENIDTYYEEHKAEHQKIIDNIKALDEKNQININIINTIKNNLKIQLINVFKTEVFEILKKYANKNIGEKTKDKLENEIESFFESKYNIVLSVHYYERATYNATREVTLSFSIAESYTIEQNYYKQDYKSFNNFLAIDNQKECTILFYILNNAENISRYDNIEEYIQYNNKYYKVIDYINESLIVRFEDIDKFAKLAFTERKKAIEKIKKIKKELENIKDEYNKSQFAKGFLCSQNYIDSSRI